MRKTSAICQPYKNMCKNTHTHTTDVTQYIEDVACKIHDVKSCYFQTYARSTHLMLHILALPLLR